MGTRLTGVMRDIASQGEAALRKHVPFIRWLQTKNRRQLAALVNAARIAGVSLDEFWWIVDVNHSRGCACWACIGRLQAWIVRSRG